MVRSKNIPLARGLIGGKTDPIYGQFEVFLTNRKNVKVIIKRKPYSGHSDINFSIPCTDLQDIIDVLYEAKKQLDSRWLSNAAIAQLNSQ